MIGREAMGDTIERYKRREQLSVEEELRYRRDYELPETYEYVEARREALVEGRAGG